MRSCEECRAFLWLVSKRQMDLRASQILLFRFKCRKLKFSAEESDLSPLCFAPVWGGGGVGGQVRG